MKLFLYATLSLVLATSLCSCDDDFDNTVSSQADTAITHTVNAPPPTPKEISIQNGRDLFKKNCAMCHAIGNAEITGPGMEGITTRVPQPYDKWLLQYIKNNVAVRESGDVYARKLYEKSNHIPMTVFDTILNDNQIKYIINYIALAKEPVS